MKLNKKIIVILSILGLFTTGCTSSSSFISNPKKTTSKYENLLITDIKYNKEDNSISFSVENKGDTTLSTGLYYNIEKYNENEEWINTKLTDNLAFIEIALIIAPHEILQEKIDLSMINQLEDGYYRIVKNYNDENSTNIIGYVQFEVNNGNFENFIGYNQ